MQGRITCVRCTFQKNISRNFYYYLSDRVYLNLAYVKEIFEVVYAFKGFSLAKTITEIGEVVTECFAEIGYNKENFDNIEDT